MRPEFIFKLLVCAGVVVGVWVWPSALGLTISLGGIRWVARGKATLGHPIIPWRKTELEGSWARFCGVLAIITGLLLAYILKDVSGARDVDWSRWAS
jgi:hypothetical protein